MYGVRLGVMYGVPSSAMHGALSLLLIIVLSPIKYSATHIGSLRLVLGSGEDGLDWMKLDDVLIINCT